MRTGKRFKKYISKNWFWIIAGLILTGVFIRAAYTGRGHISYGGEWLTLPLVLMTAESVRGISDVLKRLFKK